MQYIPSTRRPSLAEVLTLATIYQLHTTDDNTVLLVHRPFTDPMRHARDPPLPPLEPPPRVYVPMLMHPWVLHTCYSTTSFHLGVSRTLSMLRCFYWWIGRDISTRWCLRHCLKCQARKTSRHTIRWSTLSLPLPNGPGILVSVDYSGPLPFSDIPAQKPGIISRRRSTTGLGGSGTWKKKNSCWWLYNAMIKKQKQRQHVCSYL